MNVSRWAISQHKKNKLLLGFFQPTNTFYFQYFWFEYNNNQQKYSSNIILEQAQPNYSENLCQNVLHLSIIRPLTHFFLHRFYHQSMDLDQIYRFIYNSKWIHMFLMTKYSLPSFYAIQIHRVANLKLLPVLRTELQNFQNCQNLKF